MNKKIRRLGLIILILIASMCCFFIAGCSCNGCSKDNEQIEFSIISKEFAMEVGTTAQIDVVKNQDVEVLYVSENEGTAKVDNSGLVTAVAEGTTFIKVTVGQESEYVKVTVSESHYAISLAQEKLTLVVGSVYTLNASVFSNGEEVGDAIEWSVDVTDITKCQLVADGKSATFNAFAVGEYKIVAKNDKGRAECEVKVVSKQAKRLDTPKLSLNECVKLSWSAVDGAKAYDVMIDGLTDWLRLSQTEFNLGEYISGDNLLKDGESVDVYVVALSLDDFDKIDSYAVSKKVEHEYVKEAQTQVSCTVSGVMKYTCSVCAVNYTDNYYFAEHNYVNLKCTVCYQEKTNSIMYGFDDNYLPMPDREEAKNPESEWSIRFAPYYKDYLISKASTGSKANEYVELSKTYLASNQSKAVESFINEPDTAKSYFKNVTEGAGNLIDWAISEGKIEKKGDIDTKSSAELQDIIGKFFQTKNNDEIIEIINDALTNEDNTKMRASLIQVYLNSLTAEEQKPILDNARSTIGDELRTVMYLYIAVYNNREKIPETDREKCYFVLSYTGSGQETLWVKEKYDDGINGELPVKYCAPLAFNGLSDVKRIIFPESVTELRGEVFKSSNVETIVLPGLTYLPLIDQAYYGANNFNYCHLLKEVVVGDGFTADGRNFYSQRTTHKAICDIFVKGDGTLKKASYLHVNVDTSPLVTGNTEYMYQPENPEDYVCGMWYFDDDYNIVLIDHIFDFDTCTHCGIENTYGVNYLYDSKTDSYYVANARSVSKSVVKILDKYDDMIHGEKLVKKVGNSAFKNNTKIKEVYLPDTVSSVEEYAFQGCTNLKIVQARRVAGFSGKIFENCVNLEKLIVGRRMFIGHAFQSSKVSIGKMCIYYDTSYANGESNLSIDKQSNLFSGKVYMYSETEADGSFYYDSRGVAKAYDIDSYYQYEKPNIFTLYREHGELDENGVCLECDMNVNTFGLYYTFNKSTQTYSVVGYYDETMTTVKPFESFNDGVNGRKPVKSIATSAFANNQMIEKVILPNCITSIGSSAFKNCANLTYVQAKGPAGFSGDIFENCVSLEKLVVGRRMFIGHAFKTDKLERGNMAIYYDVAHNNGDAHIQVDAESNIFSGKVYKYSETKDVGAFYYDENGNAVSYNELSYYTYVSANKFNYPVDANLLDYTYSATAGGYFIKPSIYFANILPADGKLVVPATYDDGVNGEKPVVGVSNEAFNENTKLKEIYLPDSVVTLGLKSFRKCTSLKVLSAPGVSGTLNETAFGCTSLTKVVVGNGTIFGSSWKLDGVVEPILDIYVNHTDSTNISISITTSVNTTKETLLFTKKVYLLGETGVNGTYTYDSDNHIVTPNDSESFYWYTKTDTLTDCKLPAIIYTVNTGKTGYILSSAGDNFVNVYKNGILVVPETYDDGVNGELPVVAVANGAFNQISSLKEIYLPLSVKSLGTTAFRKCTSLKVLSAPGVTGTLHDTAFGCTSLTKVVVGNGTNFGTSWKLDGQVTPKLDIYLYHDNASTAELSITTQVSASETMMFTKNVYVYSENSSSGAWCFVDGVPTAYDVSSYYVYSSGSLVLGNAN